MLKAIVNFLNLKLELLNYFDLTRCLCELKRKGDVVAPKEYVSAGEWQNIDFDSSDGVSYWRLRNPISVTRETNPNKALKRVQTTVPMKLVFSVRRDKLTTDDAYSFDRIRQTIVKQFNIDNGALTTALGAAKVTITAPSSDGDPLSVWEDETDGTGKQEPDFKYVFGSIDIDIVIDSDTDCLATECDDVDSDILHTFDFCDAAVRDRLTSEQVTCLEDALCGVCADATVQLNGSTIGTISSGATGDFPITQDGSPVGSWNGSAWIIPPATGGATLEIGVFSDAGHTTPITEADFGDTVYIKGVVTGITATRYYLYIDNGIESILPQDNVTGEFSYDVDIAGTLNIVIVAVDASTGVAQSAPFELTVAGFFPPTITGCVLWIDADRLDTYTFNGANVSQQDDLSGNSNHISSPVASTEPLYLDTGAGLNGLRSVRYDGNEYQQALGLSLDIVSGSSIFIVASFTSLALYNQALLSSGNTLLDGAPYLILQQNGATIRTFAQTGNYSSTYSISANRKYLFEIHRTPTQEDFLIDGVSMHVRAIGTAGNRNNIYVNSGYNGQSESIIADIDIHNVVLTAPQKLEIRDYLIDKWDI